MDAATLIIGGGAVAFAGLLGLAASGERGLNAFGLEKFGWESRWCAYTPEKYREVVARVARDMAPSERLQVAHGVAAIYRDMERVREVWDADPALPDAHYDFTSAAAWRYNALVQAVRAGDVSVLSADERARLRMFLEAARAYLTIAANVRQDVRVADLARVLCLSEDVVEERTRGVLEVFVELVLDDFRTHLSNNGVRDVESLDEDVRTFERRVRDAAASGDASEAARTYAGKLERARRVRDVARDMEANLDELRAQLQRLRVRHVRPLTLVRNPISVTT
jgi:hypothetical protein